VRPSGPRTSVHRGVGEVAMMQCASEAMFDASDAEFSIILWIHFEPQVVMDHIVLVNEVVSDTAA